MDSFSPDRSSHERVSNFLSSSVGHCGVKPSRMSSCCLIHSYSTAATVGGKATPYLRHGVRGLCHSRKVVLQWKPLKASEFSQGKGPWTAWTSIFSSLCRHGLWKRLAVVTGLDRAISLVWNNRGLRYHKAVVSPECVTYLDCEVSFCRLRSNQRKSAHAADASMITTGYWGRSSLELQRN